MKKLTTLILSLTTIVCTAQMEWKRDTLQSKIVAQDTVHANNKPVKYGISYDVDGNGLVDRIAIFDIKYGKISDKAQGLFYDYNEDGKSDFLIKDDDNDGLMEKVYKIKHKYYPRT